MADFLVPETVIPEPGLEAVVPGLTEFGTWLCQSVRRDFADAPKFTGVQSEKTLTRVEYGEIPWFYKEGTLQLKYTGTVTQIRLLNLPIGKYTLNINNMNIMESRHQEFVITEEKLWQLRTTHAATVCTCLDCMPLGIDLNKFDLRRICFSKELLHQMPNEIQIEYVLVTAETVRETIYLNQYILHTAHPTKQLILNVEMTNPDACLQLFVNNQCVFKSCGPWSVPRELLVFTFQNNILSGVANRFLKQQDTCNFSRLPATELVLDRQDGEIVTVACVYYMTYDLPNEIIPSLRARFFTEFT